MKYYDQHSGEELSPEYAAKKDPDDMRVKEEYTGRSILSFVNKDDPLGDTPPNLADPMILRWEGGTFRRRDDFLRLSACYSVLSRDTVFRFRDGDSFDASHKSSNCMLCN